MLLSIVRTGSSDAPHAILKAEPKPTQPAGVPMTLTPVTATSPAAAAGAASASLNTTTPQQQQAPQATQVTMTALKCVRAIEYSHVC